MMHAVHIGTYELLESPHSCLSCCFQGGFAYCYELTDMDTMEIYAGKVVSKTLLVKPHQKDKVT